MASIVYLSHPLGSSQNDEVVQHYDNISNAGEWLGFLIEHTRWAVMCPWLAYLRASGFRDLHRPRALVDQIRMLERSDLVIQVGGWKSPHMLIEERHALRNDMPVLDLTSFGYVPSKNEHELDKTIKYLRDQGAAIVKSSKPRRVWLPPLQKEDIDALRAAQLVLRADPFSQEAALAIERIVQAALRP